MSADLLLHRLWGVCEDGYAQWRSYCPACQSQTHSLLIRETAEGVRLHCDRECPPWMIARAAGVPMSILAPDEDRACALEPGWWLVPRRYAKGA